MQRHDGFSARARAVTSALRRRVLASYFWEFRFSFLVKARCSLRHASESLGDSSVGTGTNAGSRFMLCSVNGRCSKQGRQRSAKVNFGCSYFWRA